MRHRARQRQILHAQGQLGNLEFPAGCFGAHGIGTLARPADHFEGADHGRHFLVVADELQAIDIGTGIRGALAPRGHGMTVCGLLLRRGRAMGRR